MAPLPVSRSKGPLRDERGMALLIAVVLLLLMSALGITALQHAQDEASASGRSRRKDATLYAGEAGLAMIESRLLDNWAAHSTADFTIDSTAMPGGMVNDSFGYPIAVRSGTPSSSTPAAITQGDGNNRVHEDGFTINQGSQAAQLFSAVRADITAGDAATSMVFLQAQFRVHEGSGGGSY